LSTYLGQYTWTVQKGFGIRLNPYDFEENVLLESIEKSLNDEKLALKLEKISERIQSSKRISKLAELIENLVV
jgi:UDP:flavonoid glycosyltransferase YjiC (YdhE family)